MTSLSDAPQSLGPLPHVGTDFIATIERAGLVGRGGAAFPTAVKWRAVVARSRGDAVVVVNGAEAEPRSQKDRFLMTARPHLVLDGAFIAAHVLGARRVFLYIGERHSAAGAAILGALAERGDSERSLVTVAWAPGRYVAGAETAAVHFLNEVIATPTTTPPYPFERGVGGAPTLVQNVETLARIALMARGEFADTVLVTLAGGFSRPGVYEFATGITLDEAVGRAGGFTEPPRAVLVGGYFGAWRDFERASQLRLDHQVTSLGCGVIGALPSSRCPVCDVAGIMRYLAGESSAQCGPCLFGLRALADACTRVAEGTTDGRDVARLERWAGDVRGRGACRHPDGAVVFLSSALKAFAGEFAHHSHAVSLSA